MKKRSVMLPLVHMKAVHLENFLMNLRVHFPSRDKLSETHLKDDNVPSAELCGSPATELSKAVLLTAWPCFEAIPSHTCPLILAQPYSLTCDFTARFHMKFNK